MSYIKVEHVDLGYEGKSMVWDLNFKLDKNDYLCVVGENGVGKSTLIKTLLSLTKPIKGKIELGDGLKPYEIGYLPQQTIVQRDFPATVGEIVLSGCLPHLGKRLFYGKAEKEMAKEKMELMGIYHLRKKSYRFLSGGQQQRALLARALCAASKVILLDEPVTGLDPKATAEFYQTVVNLNKSGLSVIMVTHDIQAVDYASHVLHVSAENSFYGSKKEYTKSNHWKILQAIGGNEHE